MSKEIKLSLLALVVIPVFAIWFFWGRSSRDTTTGSSPAPSPEPAHDTAPAAFAAPATSPVAASAGESAPTVALQAPAPSSSIGPDGEVRTRLILRNRPSFLKGTPLGCDPPFTTDVEGKRHYKKECF
jgi:hypothetical protein